MEERMISFDLSRLPEKFERNGLTPKCLSTVVNQMKSSGQLQPVSHYQKSNGWLLWGFNTLVKQPVFWGVTQLIGSPKKDSDVFVCPDVVKVIAAEILEIHQSCVKFSVVDSFVSLAQLKQSCQHLIREDKDFDIILTHLERANHIALSQINSGDVVVKFRREGESRVSFEEIDFNIYSIKMAVEKLEKEIDSLTSRIDRHLLEAKANVKEGRKKMALMCLKRKASLQKLMERKMGSLTMLHEIMQKIEEARTNEMVVRACEAGVGAMKALNQEVTAEQAESVMEDLDEAMATQEEVNTVISSPISTTEEEDLERSLEELLREESEEQIVKKSHFPPLPSFKPGSKYSVPEADTITPEEDDIAAAFLNLDIDDLGLPEVPSHSRHSNSDQHRKRETHSPAFMDPAS
ncbi:charged multivesicular body protein 7 [Elysia marginata]|uniref:Charged multivesicular body protein 7 n=1 Tax=Elysia marginata TaxID=1093978 RepID=A0AAV4ID49_9GAST|nr:charged multivesicular body protein 7 [Elysia marginata]